MSTTIAPLAPELWAEFEDLFGKQGACYGCWCTHFRLAPAMRRESSRERNKDHIKARIEAGPPPGLLAFEDGQAVGWMQIGPRADVPEWNNQGRGSAPVDPADATDPAVWAISCFFIRGKARGRGITHRLVEGGIDFARQNGARLLEDCSIDLSRDSLSI
ncbi:GNAT family N-acetyltransferase, partial [Mesorhizobium sp. M7A.F.Ca.CA.002.06.1.1]|uniref:GNAT family N-acetyltransferase n=1 Tax=Mesorhizobium sp. M7A.F.Ca.CA.002.06.1.1 TaxID=2496705 RepID=UPI000FD521AE